ncbi:hypothetical protein MNB_SUP05-12-242 [hydrothermal vent metagenome]|uniref:Uncharacterized protein n=1 Tax=hydrothermal vent metagenome TaxID=652676 RepID=A0A1W1DGK1_9ZZZZ
MSAIGHLFEYAKADRIGYFYEAVCVKIISPNPEHQKGH